MPTPRKKKGLPPEDAEALLARLHTVRVGLFELQLHTRDSVRDGSAGPEASAAWRRLRAHIVDLMRVIDAEMGRISEALDACE